MILQTLQSLSQKRTLEYLAFVLILILATVLSCYKIAEPAWDATPIDFSGGMGPGWPSFHLCEWGGIARHYLKFNYPKTGLGQAAYQLDWSRSNRFHHRVDHPPMLPLFISLSYRLFGIHEWSVRLVPLLTSLGLVPLVFWLGRKLGDKKVALTASFFFALLPERVYYSTLPAPHILGSFFSWLTIVSYLQWVETRSTKWCAAVYASFILAALSGWASYFVVPTLLLHYIICGYRKTRNLKFMLSFGILPVVLLSVHFGWAYMMGGKWAVQGLLGRFVHRTVSGGFGEGKLIEGKLILGDLYATAYARFKFFFTPTICILSAVWLTSFLTTPLRKKFSSQNMVIAALFLFGLSPNLVFQDNVIVHDFVMLFNFTPLFAILAALAARWIAEKALFNRRVLTIPFYLIICYLLATQATAALKRLHNIYVDANSFLVGSKVNEITDESAKVMSSLKPDYRNYLMRFYADRPWSMVRNLQELTSLLQIDSSYTHYAFDNREPLESELKEYLVRNHPVENLLNYSFFDLQALESNVIVQNPQIEHPVEANFDDKLMFLGYNVEEMIQKKREPSWLEKYLKGHAEFLVEHRTFFRITYFWQCLEEMKEDYTLVTQFEGHHGKIYHIDQSHRGVNSIYPISSWRKGEIIREEYQVEVPADYPPIRYALWVGVRDGEERLEVTSDVEIDGEARARLGQIEVLPAERPTPLAAEPQPQNRVEVDFNDELLFLGYDLSERSPQPGDRLKVTTYWQSLRKTERDYAIQVELRNGGYKVREMLDTAPTRLWEKGRYYQGDAVIAINPLLLEGTYSVNLGLERDDGTETQISLASLDIPCQRQHIIRRLGKANYGGSEFLSPDEPFSLRFDLGQREALELVSGWTGKAEGEETRVEVYISNAYWRDRYLGTWVVESGNYRVTKRKIGKVFTAPGENMIELRVPEVREKVHNVGWRGVVDLVLPDLLQDPRTDYDGPIQMDFAQVSTRWEGNWDDYYDLAKMYAGRGMDREVARLYEEVLDKGVEPGQVDEFALFKRAYRALGEEGKVGEIEERIAERIAHKMNVNLGGKVEFLGYDLTRLDNCCTQMSLFFRCVEEMEEDYTLWVHGEVEDEALLEGHKAEAGYAVFDHLVPTSRWELEGVYQDDEMIGLRPGRYHFTLGLWRPEDGSRLWREDDPDAHVIDLGWIEIK